MNAWTNLPFLFSTFLRRHCSSSPPSFPITESSDNIITRFISLSNRFTKRRSQNQNQNQRSSSRSHKPNKIGKYNRLMKSFAQSGKIHRVIRLLRESISCFGPDLFCYTTALHALASAGRHREAEALFEEMVASGLAPDTASCTALIKLYSDKLNRLDIALQVIRWMESAGCVPDVVTYSTLISGLCRAGRIEDAWKMFDDMLKRGCVPNVCSYTPILQAYCLDRRIVAAEELVRWMQSTGCSPDAVANNILIQGLCMMGRFDDSEKFIRRSESEDWKPDVITYNTFIHGLCKAGKAEEALRQLERMLDAGLQPSKVTICIVLDCLCHESEVWEVKQLLQRFGKLEFDVGVESYNSVMSRLGELGEWLAVLVLFTEIMKKGIVADAQTFNVVINSLCKAGMHPEAKYFMSRKGFKADIVSYNTLFHSFYVAGKFGEIRILFAQMHERKVAPDVVTYSTMIDCLCKERKFFEAIYFVKSLRDKITPEIIAHLTFGLVWGGKLGEMLRLFEELAGRGLVLDNCIFNALITAFCRKGSCLSKDIHRICLILDRMLGV